MENRKTVVSPGQESIFTADGQGVREVKAGSMSLVVGTSDSIVDQSDDVDVFEECTYPEIPDGASDYDTWLG